MSSSHDKRVIVYPCYLNAKRTVAQGRRIPASKACDNPSILEMLDCCTKGLALQAEAEGKRHPRDFFSDGRIRVRLKDESGKPVVPSIPNRKKAVSSAAPAGLPNLPGLKPTGGQAGTSKESAKSGSNKKKKGRK